MKFRSILAVLLAAMLLATMSSVAVAEGGKVQITIWHTFTEGQETALQSIADAFNASQSDYEVVLESQANSGFLDTVYNAVANGVGPNVIFNYASAAADYVKDGLVFDMTSYINDPEIGMTDIISSMSPAVYENEVMGFDDGGIYYLPAYTTGPIFFYNKTLYDELGLTPPTTWEELAEQSKTIYEAKGIQGFAADSLTDLMQSLFIQSGAGYIDTASKTVTFGTDVGTQWLKWFGDQVQAQSFALNPSGDYFSNDFNAGAIASYYGSCAGVPYITPDGFEYAVAPAIRGMADGTEWYPSWNRGPIAFNKSEEENMGTYLFIKFFLQPENNFAWVQATNTLSPYGTTQAVEGYAAYAEADPALKCVAANLDIAGALPAISGSNAVRNALTDTAKEVAGGNLTAEDAMAALVETCNEALAK
jgi:ABC-type glycerol-3-phosphate transport system substrate-binding protein